MTVPSMKAAVNRIELERSLRGLTLGIDPDKGLVPIQSTLHAGALNGNGQRISPPCHGRHETRYSYTAHAIARWAFTARCFLSRVT